jgi:hypothetical protein
MKRKVTGGLCKKAFFDSLNMLYVGGGWNLKGEPDDAQFLGTVLMLDLSQKALRWETINQPFKRRRLALARARSTLLAVLIPPARPA